MLSFVDLRHSLGRRKHYEGRRERKGRREEDGRKRWPGGGVWTRERVVVVVVVMLDWCSV